MMKKSSDYFWLWMPIVFCLLLSSGYFIVNALTDSHKDNPGAVIYAVCGVLRTDCGTGHVNLVLQKNTQHGLEKIPLLPL